LPSTIALAATAAIAAISPSSGDGYCQISVVIFAAIFCFLIADS